MKKLTVLILFILGAVTLVTASETKAFSVNKARDTGTETITIRYKVKEGNTWVNKLFTASVSIPEDTEKGDKAGSISSAIKLALKEMSSRPFSSSSNGGTVTVTAAEGTELTSAKCSNNTHQIRNQTSTGYTGMAYCTNLAVMTLEGFAEGLDGDGNPGWIQVGTCDLGSREAFCFTKGKNIWQIMDELKFKMIKMGIPCGVDGNRLFFFIDEGSSISWSCTDKGIVQIVSRIDVMTLVNDTVETLNQWVNEDVCASWVSISVPQWMLVERPERCVWYVDDEDNDLPDVIVPYPLQSMTLPVPPWLEVVVNGDTVEVWMPSVVLKL